MPKFHFHINDGLTVVKDAEGCELADLAEAKAEALADCRAHAIAQLTLGRPFPLWTAVIVCNPEGDPLHIEWCCDLLPGSGQKHQYAAWAKAGRPLLEPVQS